MLWIDSVPSAAYHQANTPPRTTVNTTVVASSGTPRLSERLSVTNVPTTLISATASQYIHGTYRSARTWNTSATTSRTAMTMLVTVRPRFRFTLRKSAAVSPTVVHRTLITQK